MLWRATDYCLFYSHPSSCRIHRQARFTRQYTVRQGPDSLSRCPSTGGDGLRAYLSVASGFGERIIKILLGREGGLTTVRGYRLLLHLRLMPAIQLLLHGSKFIDTSLYSTRLILTNSCVWSCATHPTAFGRPTVRIFAGGNRNIRSFIFVRALHSSSPPEGCSSIHPLLRQ